MLSFQGRRLDYQSFPSPAYATETNGFTFRSRSRCLIDLSVGGQDVVLLVLTEGAEGQQAGGPHLAYQRSIYRLELPSSERDSITFADASRKTKQECESELKAELAALPNLQIVGVDFPFFEKHNLQGNKSRPCIALWGDERPSLYLSIYMGASRPNTEASAYPWEIVVEGGAEGDLTPSYASMAVIDVSKMCTLPDKVHRPMKPQVDGQPTWWYWLLNPKKEHSALYAKNDTQLREKIIERLIKMLNDSPLSYVDTTRGMDEGEWIEKFARINGEWCTRFEKYSYSPEPSATVPSGRYFEEGIPAGKSLSIAGSGSDSSDEK